MDERLKYPIGKYSPPSEINSAHIVKWISEIRELPSQLRAISEPLTDAQLGMTYRSGSWNVRQLIHHIGDSHLNSYVRFKWTLTENTPTIKAYDEAAWAEMIDSQGPIGPALDLVNSLHSKWVYLIEKMNAKDWDRTFIHPQNNRKISLKWNVGLYAWHGKHHLEHIRIALG